MGGKVCLRCKGKILLGIVDKLLKTKSLLTTPSNVSPLHLKQILSPIIWIFTEGEGDRIESRQPFEIFPTLCIKVYFTLWVRTFTQHFRKKSKLKILTRKRKVRGSPCTQNGLTFPYFHNGQGRGLWHNGHNLTYHTLHKSRLTLWHHNLKTKII